MNPDTLLQDLVMQGIVDLELYEQLRLVDAAELRRTLALLVQHEDAATVVDRLRKLVAARRT
jgi:hypothetical protein